MSSAAARLEFAPPPTPGWVRSLALAFLAHAALLAVLTMGLRWKHDVPIVAVEAELWSALPQQAAPPPVVPPPPEPPPQPTKPVALPPPAPTAPDPAIAIAKEKARQREIKLEQERQDQHKRELLRAKQEQEARNKEAHDKALRDKLAREKKLQEDQKRTEAAKAAESKRLAELRRQQLERIARMASQSTGNGDASSAGTAARSSGPSASYAGRIAARIKPNITYTDPIVGNPVADVEVRTSPDGTIISRRLVKSSGVKSWDDAVLAAIDKTEKIPADVDGRVIPSLTLGFRPRD